MLKRLVSGTVLATAVGAMVLGGTSPVHATTVPDASCNATVSTGPVLNIVYCTVSTALQIPMDLPESGVTIGKMSGEGLGTFSGFHLYLVELEIEHVFADNPGEDDFVLRALLLDALNDADIFDRELDFSDVSVDSPELDSAEDFGTTGVSWSVISEPFSS